MATRLNNATIIDLCLYFKQDNTAKILLNEISAKEINSSPFLQKYKAILQASSNEKLVQEIATYPIKEDEKADLHLSAASNCVAANDLKGAEEHLQAAINAQPDNEDFKHASFLTAVLNGDAEKKESSFNKLDAETRAEIFSTFAVSVETSKSTLATTVRTKTATETITAIETAITAETNPTNETNYSEVELDEKEIHAHFQAIKAQRLAELSSFSNNSDGWKIGNETTPINETIPLGIHYGLKYFGCIPEEFSGPAYKAFREALVKGFAKRAEGINGIKAFEGVFEIKIDGSARLFTNIVYKNAQGQLLLIFDKYGTHEAAKKFAKANKRQTILTL